MQKPKPQGLTLSGRSVRPPPEQSLAFGAMQHHASGTMALEIVEDHEERLRAHIATLNPLRPVTPEEFDAIAKYVVVADELANEPYMSDDNHEGLVFVGAEKKMHARFGHPAFLKSAILPFRKLWMPSEPCQFEKVRKLIFDLFSETTRPGDFLTPQVSAYRMNYEWPHEQSLVAPVDPELATAKVKTVKQVVDLWIYTQGAHTGKTNPSHEFELRDFDEVVTQSGRARLESAFRSSLYLIGHNSYLSFYRVLVRPIFERLLALGYKPKFETHAALKFGPYPKQTDHIVLDDPFWHLDKETEEETFDRLVDRWSFQNFGSFFSGYFRARRPALDALKAYSSFDALLDGTGAVILDAPSATLGTGGNFHARGDMNHNGGQVHLYEGKTVHFGGRSRIFLNHYYRQFREAFLAHRKSIPERMNYWEQNWWGN
jgi:hypothetical protein